MAAMTVQCVEAVTIQPRVSTTVGKSPNLDLLRSVAVLCVLLWHAAISRQTTASDTLGRAGVILFFVHTSYVLLNSLDRLHRDGRGHSNMRFLLQRVFRIYPLYLAAIVLTFCLGVPLIDTFGMHSDYPAQWFGIRWFVANLLLLQNLILPLPSVSAPMWSLPYEIQMYLALPAVYYIACRKDAVSALALVAFLSGLSSVVFSLPVTFFVPCFFGGAYAFVISRRVRPTISCFWLPALLAVGIAAITASGGHALTQWGVATVVGFILPYLREMRSSALASCCEKIATYSYGIYLWHWPLLWLFSRKLVGLPAGIAYPAWLVATALLSIASYHLLEAPMIRFGRNRCTITALLANREPAKLSNLIPVRRSQ